MSKYNYSEIKRALDTWQEDKARFENNDSQRVSGIEVGYYHPSQSNWSYIVSVELLNHVEYGMVMAETVRRFGSLEGVIAMQRLDYLIDEAQS